jgi:hypothetical protein
VAAQPLDTWHTVGAAGEPTFAAGFSSGGSATDFAPAFRKDPAGRVSLRGVLAGPNSAGTGFTLPAGYRPALPAGQTIRYNRFPITVDGVGGTAGIGYCYITDSGSVNLLITGTSGTSARWDLSSIEFDTDTQVSYPSAFVQINAPARVTTLPTSPVDGQECYYVADATNGVLWHLRYNAGSASAYKWEFVGGPRLFVAVPGSLPVVTATSPVFPAGGAQLTLPLSGDFYLEFSGSGTVSSAVYWYMSVGVAGSSVTAAGFYAGGAAGVFAHVQGQERVNGRTAGQVLQVMVNVGGGGSHSPEAHRLAVHPVRVG